MRPTHSDTAGSEPVKILSFSGIDGAGKTTQIEALTHWLLTTGVRVELLTFWDNVVVLSRFRESLSRRAFKGDQGIGSPENPLNRRDKNVTSAPVTATRFFLYFLDAVNLRRKVLRARKSNTDVVIFDRYIYDELANLPLKRWWTQAYVRLLLRFVPAPDVAYIIDADPIAARGRKPEYPLEFLRDNRQAYITMSQLASGVTVIEPLSIEAMELTVREAFLRTSLELQKHLEGLSVVGQKSPNLQLHLL